MNRAISLTDTAPGDADTPVTEAPASNIVTFEEAARATAGRRPVLLVVDDDPDVLSLVDRFARRNGFDVVAQEGAHDALAHIPAVKPDVALIDLRMSDMDGLDILRSIRDLDPNCQVVLMTANASIDTAIEAVKLGALDYLQKPFDVERLSGVLTTVRMSIQRRERLMRGDASLAKRFEFYGMIGRSPAMQQLFDLVRRVAPHARTVLIAGETGTGKELVARALHRLGPRRDRPLLTVNCSAVVDTLCESELFGHMRGSFTGASENKEGLFEHADGGTLFLDEVGELPLTMQVKLLRAVERGEIQRVGAAESLRCDVITIAATSRDLSSESANGRFRSDLFYRLGALNIRLTPLRERREDIPYLTAAFVAEFSQRLNRDILGLTAGAERLLQTSTWPGNVRELRNVLQRACVLRDGRGILTEREIARAMMVADQAAPAGQPAQPGLDPHLLSTAHRAHIERVLHEVRGNKTAAAQMLGISRRSLYRWLERLDITK